MGGNDDAEFFGELERAVKLGVVHAERSFVGEEHFERTDAALHDFRAVVARPVHQIS